MDKATLFRLAGPGRLPERAVFIASLAAMVVIFAVNLWLVGSSVRVYVLYVLPLLAIGLHSARRAYYLTGALLALSLEAAYFIYVDLPAGPFAANFAMECLVAGLCWSVADTARGSYQRMLTLAQTDDLTGLLNRRAFVLATEQEIERQTRYGGRFSIALLDLDGFKVLNDAHGHEVGDVALRQLAEALRNSTRRTDTVARLGGDEFVVLLPNTPKEACSSICYQLRGAIADGLDGSAKFITASIGSITFDMPPESVDAALRGADEAMYRAKHNGGDCVVSA